MRFNFGAAGVGAMLALFAVACGDVVTRTIAPGAASYGKTGGPTAGTVNYTGQGFTLGDLNDQRCGLPGETAADDGSTGLFANWNGAGQPYQAGQAYLVWVLTGVALPATATLTLPDGPHAMIPVGGTLKFASQYFDPATLLALPAHADFTAAGSNNPQLVVSHGCPGFKKDQGVFCSPGFWRNAADGAWNLIGFTDQAAGFALVFNNTVVPSFYDTPSALNPTVGNVLTYTGPGGADHFGAASGPFTPNLNAFNATGAYLTNFIPGFQFSIDAYVAYLNSNSTTDNCPIDHFGNFLP